MTREDELFKQIRQGEKGALEELVQLYYPRILTYCYWHLTDRTLAEDAVQETFLKAVRYLPSYVHKGKFQAFLYQIASNVCIDIQRKRQADPLDEEMGYLEPGYERLEEGEDFMQLLVCLPQEMKELVVLRYGQNLKLREIADVCHLPVRTVQSRLRAALKKIKKYLKEAEDYE